MKDNTENASFKSLVPIDTVPLILRWLTPKEMAKVRQVSTGCQTEAENPIYWRKALIDYFYFREETVKKIAAPFFIFSEKMLNKKIQEDLRHITEPLKGFNIMLACLCPGCINPFQYKIEKLVLDIRRASNFQKVATLLDTYRNTIEEKDYNTFHAQAIADAITRLQECTQPRKTPEIKWLP